MKPAPFSLALPERIDDALALLAEHGEAARICAGGQSLSAMLNMRLASPDLLIDISGIDDLKTIAVRDGAIEVGAAVTQDALLRWPELATAQPLLALMLPWVGHYQTRQRGTVCGSLAHADPSSELPLALMHLGGEVILQSRRRRRVVPAIDFQVGMMTTAVKADEMIIACRFPVAAPGTTAAFHEVAQRHGDFAIVAVSATGSAKGVRIGAGGVADVPRAIDLPWLDGDALDAALNDFAWALGGSDDQHASARYRRELVRRLARRVAAEVSHARA